MHSFMSSYSTHINKFCQYFFTKSLIGNEYQIMLSTFDRLWGMNDGKMPLFNIFIFNLYS